MALPTHLEFQDPTSAMRAQRTDRSTMDDINDRDAGRSNFAAFVLGGVVIAGGMFGFLYYDAETRNDTITTGSVSLIEQRENAPPTLRIPAQPQAVPAR